MARAEKKTEAGEKPQRISLFGSTGSIGLTTLKIITAAPKRYTVDTLTANGNYQLLAEQAKQVKPARVVIANKEHYSALKSLLQYENIQIEAGEDAITQAAAETTDKAIIGIVGVAALKPTLAAIEVGATIGLANKECLVCAGDILLEKAKKKDAKIIPVDSEHNAIYQALQGESAEKIDYITITASGGPFRGKTRAELEDITPQEAVRHPNWSMGAKISIDSATMMNKGLELIEAHHLFSLPAQRIEVLVHPESIMHGMVHHKDGSVIGVMGHPDMATPISYALAWPHREAITHRKLNLAELGKLTFERPDEKNFSALRLAREALQTGGTAPCIYNATNEMAVEYFLKGKIKFTAISDLVEAALQKLPASPAISIEQVFAADSAARQFAADWVNKVIA